MESQEIPNQLTSQNSVSPRLVNELLIESSGICMFKTYTILELIKSITAKGGIIMAVYESFVPSGVDLANDDITKGEFRRKFFGNVLFDQEDEKNAFAEIVKVLDNEVAILNVSIAAGYLFPVSEKNAKVLEDKYKYHLYYESYTPILTYYI